MAVGCVLGSPSTFRKSVSSVSYAVNIVKPSQANLRFVILCDYKLNIFVSKRQLQP